MSRRMQRACPRCRTTNRDEARFCAGCGLSLDFVPGEAPRAGRIRHPRPKNAPDDFEQCEGTEDLHFQWKSAWGSGTFLGTEPIAVTLFNGGYPLESVELKVTGTDTEGKSAFDIEMQVSALPHGETVEIEVPSYEYSTPAATIKVTLVSAEFGSEP